MDERSIRKDRELARAVLKGLTVLLFFSSG